MGHSEVIVLDGHSLSIEDIVRVARHNAKVELAPEALEAVERASDLVHEWASGNDVIYGINTGFGDLATVPISRKDRRQLQENLLKSHACGVGEPFDEETVRAIMLLRINTLIKGHSGIKTATLQRLTDYLNMGIHPMIPSQGSVGSSGDLCPLSHLAITLLGIGEVFYKGRRQPAQRLFRKLGMSPLNLEAKEGLALNNGTTVMTAIAALALYDGVNTLKMSDIAAALSLEALHGVPFAFDERTHALRPYRGQMIVASNIRRLIAGSQIIEKFKGERVQDAYSLRCMPQVHGASRDALDYVWDKVSIEINAVTDNPLIFVDDRVAISGGNFHGQPIALAMDFFGIAMAEIANISERRVARLVDSSLSGLPPFLIQESGLNSGFMIPQYAAASIVSENKVLAHPSSVDSIPTSANQEDHVSMGTYGARKGRTILNNARKVLAIELLSAAQALDFSILLKPGAGTKAAHHMIRKAVPFLKYDDYLYPLIRRVQELMDRSEILHAVEEAIGPLD
ncbi:MULTISPECIES: histidine ammonia-lyase [Aminobacterium]|jgi:histidine ammonia-lyase|uniref:histidine ammonia-lyase n=1 Tax=Aminobacterium TaxID=81466 RepID=UPI000A921FE2|nr:MULTISPECIES: histidine ammonia-lyase [unclassified Aminobacterium]MDD2379931.1 histidine ammonia-lyase [Aminobacterium colombiense]MDD3768486.1 histidine ammonia-lyase [Aminobacterium colombiense]MDD4266442.1 histidine ammonia-lyase [Aminobacterium colombiense]MDD4585844.1 histidine ammonia-lyase [Aminobacterium colombiense]